MLFLENEKSKNIILTYQLEKSEIEVLQHTLQTLGFCGTLASVKEPGRLFSIPHLMAFLNFASLDEGREQAFLTKLQTKAQKSLPEQSGKRKMPLTYILNCKTLSGKIPHIFVNRDIFADKEKLRLTLLQEIKAVEINKPNQLVSERLTRILWMYRDLLYDGYLKHDSNLSNRRFYQDVGIIKKLIPDIKYDRIQGKYITHYLIPHLPDKEETSKSLIATHMPVRMKRVLLIYQQLLYDGWITKEVADALCTPVSLRMFQRDLAVIESRVARSIVYDMDQQKYILATCAQGQSPTRIRHRNEYKRVW